MVKPADKPIDKPIEQPVEPPVSHAPEGRAWWRDPVGDGLVGLGVVGLGVGTAMLVAAHSADQDKNRTMSYAEFQTLQDKAKTDGKIGVIAAISGGALVTVGIIWYATHRSHAEHTTVSGWLVPGSGGLAITGAWK